MKIILRTFDKAGEQIDVPDDSTFGETIELIMSFDDLQEKYAGYYSVVDNKLVGRSILLSERIQKYEKNGAVVFYLATLKNALCSLYVLNILSTNGLTYKYLFDDDCPLNLLPLTESSFDSPSMDNHPNNLLVVKYEGKAVTFNFYQYLEAIEKGNEPIMMVPVSDEMKQKLNQLRTENGFKVIDFK
jgi:hypothetical protein